MTPFLSFLRPLLKDGGFASVPGKAGGPQIDTFGSISRARITCQYRKKDLFWPDPLKVPVEAPQVVQPYFNYIFNKGRLRKVIVWSLDQYGQSKTVQLLEELKRCGYEYATQAGISIGLDDLKIPTTKKNLIVTGQIDLNQSLLQIQMGYLTSLEYSAQAISTWNKINDVIKNEVIAGFQNQDMLNPVFMMAFSGARGNISQVRQLAGMRGLMSDPSGNIITYPIESNFREGLTLTEYMISCYGARKGVVDTALRTATSGYLTRRLVDVAHHVVIHTDDCGTTNGIRLTGLMDKAKTKILLSLQSRLVGRVLCHTTKPSPYDNKEIDKALARKLAQLQSIYFIRSPLTCISKKMVCQKCYGWSLASQRLVAIGECVGVIAGQSIGEPGTQLTMRTFHTGGVFSGELSQELYSPATGQVRFDRIIAGKCVRTYLGQIAFCTLQSGLIYVDQTTLTIPPQTLLFVKHGQQVYKNQVIGEKYKVNENQTTYMTVGSAMDGFIRFVPHVSVKHLPTILHPQLGPMRKRLYRSNLAVMIDRPTARKEFKAHTRAKPFHFQSQPGSFWVVTCQKSLLGLTALPHLGQNGDLLDSNSPVFFYKHHSKRLCPIDVHNLIFSGSAYCHLITKPISQQQLAIPTDATTTTLKQQILLAFSESNKPSLISTNTKSCTFSLVFLHSQLLRYGAFKKTNYCYDGHQKYYTTQGVCVQQSKLITCLPRFGIRTQSQTLSKAAAKPSSYLDQKRNDWTRLQTFGHYNPKPWEKPVLQNSGLQNSFFHLVSSGNLKPTNYTIATKPKFQYPNVQKVALTRINNHYTMSNHRSTIKQTHLQMTWAWTQKKRTLHRKLGYRLPYSQTLSHKTLNLQPGNNPSSSLVKDVSLFQMSQSIYSQTFGYLRPPSASRLSDLDHLFFFSFQKSACTWFNSPSKSDNPSLAQHSQKLFKGFSLRPPNSVLSRRGQFSTVDIHGKVLKTPIKPRSRKPKKRLCRKSLSRKRSSTKKRKRLKRKLWRSYRFLQRIKTKLRPNLRLKKFKPKLVSDFAGDLKLKSKINYFNLYGWVDISSATSLRHQNQNQLCGFTDMFSHTGLVTSFFPVQSNNSCDIQKTSDVVALVMTYKFILTATVFCHYTYQTPRWFGSKSWLQWTRKYFQENWCQTVKNYLACFNVRANIIPGTKTIIWGSYVRLYSFLVFQYSSGRVLCRDLCYISHTRRYGPKLLYGFASNKLYRISQKPINAFDRNYVPKLNTCRLKKLCDRFELDQALKTLIPNQCWLFPRKFKKFLNQSPCLKSSPRRYVFLSRLLEDYGYDIDCYRPQSFVFATTQIYSTPVNVKSLQSLTIASGLKHGHGEIVNYSGQDKVLSQRYVARCNSQKLNTVYTVNINQLMCYPYLISKEFCSLGQFITPENNIIDGVSLLKSGQIFIATKQYTVLLNAQFYRVPKTSSCTLESGQFVFRQTSLFAIRYKSMKADDIIQGIPKIERLFEARSARYTGLPQLLQAAVMDYTKKTKGILDRKEIRLISLRQIQIYIVNAIQIVYQSQGVTICDKHLEIIVRQMTSKVKISNPGLTGLLLDDFILLSAVTSINKQYDTRYEADYEPCVLGITKASLQTHGFLSAASFQETIRVLGSMALKKRRDYLIGLKENLILGYMLPCGIYFLKDKSQNAREIVKTIYDYNIFVAKKPRYQRQIDKNQSHDGKKRKIFTERK